MEDRQHPRERLLEAALRRLEEGGPGALQARPLAAEIGASTMAVYTHFGGMPGLVEALVREGLRRFAAHVRQVPDSEDPMTDLIAGGLAYGEWATAHPQLYRLIFGLSDARVGSAWELAEGADAFSVLQRSVDRVMAAGRIRRQDPRLAAAQVLATTHGFLMLVIGGFLDDPGEAAELIAPLTVNLMVGLGDAPEAAAASLATALTSRQSM